MRQLRSFDEYRDDRDADMDDARRQRAALDEFRARLADGTDSEVRQRCVGIKEAFAAMGAGVSSLRAIHEVVQVLIRERGLDLVRPESEQPAVGARHA